MSSEDLLAAVIASKLKKILKLKNISSLDLSNATGVNASKISRVLTKKGNLSISELLNISKYFKVGVDYFLEHDTDLDIEYMPPRTLLGWDHRIPGCWCHRPSPCGGDDRHEAYFLERLGFPAGRRSVIDNVYVCRQPVQLQHVRRWSCAYFTGCGGAPENAMGP